MSLATATAVSSLSITVSSIVTGRPFTSKVVHQTTGSTAGTWFRLALEEEEDMVKALRTLKILEMQEVDDVFHQILRDL